MYRHKVRAKNTKSVEKELNIGGDSAEVYLDAVPNPKEQITTKTVHVKYGVSPKGEQLIEIHNTGELEIILYDKGERKTFKVVSE